MDFQAIKKNKNLKKKKIVVEIISLWFSNQKTYFYSFYCLV